MSTRILTEWLNEGIGLTLKAGAPLESFRSSFQQVDVVETDALGRVFLLDGSLMTSVADEWFYHEPLVHLAAISHPAPRHCLIVGGGDGGSARQLLKHPSVESITICELDQAVLDIARRHFQPVHQGALDDARVTVVVSEGQMFLAESTQQFDLIVLDLSDPVGPAVALYTSEFFALCKQHLTQSGALSLHLGSPQFQAQRVAALVQNLRSVFPKVRPYLVPIALYGGLWAMACASEVLDPRKLDSTQVAVRMAERNIEGLNYYSAAMHGAMQVLPPFVERIVS